MKNKVKYDIIVMIIGILLNIIMGHLVIILKIPFLFMDSAGTILTAVHLVLYTVLLLELLQISLFL